MQMDSPKERKETWDQCTDFNGGILGQNILIVLQTTLTRV